MNDKQPTESPNRLVMQTVWPFVFIVIVLLITMMLSLELTSSVRAYVGGESLYSKAQKQAYISLVNYLRTHSEKDYQEFLMEIAVPLGDNKARLVLDQAKPDLETANTGFIEGKNHPDDVPGMIRLYRYFGNTPLMKDPIRIWTEADSDILKLLNIGRLLHKKIKMGGLDNAVKSKFIQELNAINQHITPLEEEFSSSIAKVSRQIDHLISTLLIGLTALLMGLGFVFSHRLAFQRVSSSKALRKESEKSLAFLRNASDGIHILDSIGNVQEASDAFCTMMGYSRNEIIGMNVTQWDAHFNPEDIPSILQSIIDKGTRSQFETVHRRKDASQFDVEISILPIVLDGNHLLFCSSRDISERKRNEQQVEHLAYHDQLTGLPNRALFVDRMNQAMAASRRYNRFGAVFFVDLDKFKTINDVHGHAIGDLVIKEVARRLTYQLRQSDTVSRFGGDEFVILVNELSANQDTAAKLAHSVAELIRTALEKPVRINDQELIVTSSIGISLFPKENETVEDMIREADIAMYRAKENGRNALVFFEHDMQAHIAERYAVEKDLRYALKNEELELHLQSQVDRGGAIVSAEGLVRWRHPSRGLVSPAAFIPLAEETGLIVQIGEWVLREACRFIAQLNAMGRSLRIAVNVSPRQFHQSNFVTRVREILVETGADPLYLTFEVTENLLVDRTMEAVSSMMKLSELGIRFSIDDFGTGYSSLSYLKRLPLSELKIDKSFVQDVPHDSNDVALVETILSMSHHLGFEVVAEGVETKVQYEFLAKLGCEFYQGYFFHRPQRFQDWLACVRDKAS